MFGVEGVEDCTRTDGTRSNKRVQHPDTMGQVVSVKIGESTLAVRFGRPDDGQRSYQSVDLVYSSIIGASRQKLHQHESGYSGQLCECGKPGKRRRMAA
jgi:hypothetical protein